MDLKELTEYCNLILSQRNHLEYQLFVLTKKVKELEASQTKDSNGDSTESGSGS